MLTTLPSPCVLLWFDLLPREIIPQIAPGKVQIGYRIQSSMWCWSAVQFWWVPHNQVDGLPTRPTLIPLRLQPFDMRG